MGGGRCDCRTLCREGEAQRGRPSVDLERHHGRGPVVAQIGGGDKQRVAGTATDQRARAETRAVQRDLQLIQMRIRHPDHRRDRRGVGPN